jgi:ankyrin repeat protein
MTNWKMSAVLTAIFGIAGCFVHSTSSQAGSASTQPSGTSSQAFKFFPDPDVAALAAALECSDWTGAETALRAGADVNATGKEGVYPLVWTMYVKNKPAFEWLLNHGADPNFDSGGGDGSVLIWAAKADDPDWLRVLLAHKANPNLTHKTSIGTTETPLLAAGGICRLTNVKMLIAAGADINYEQPEHDGKGTPAIDAAEGGWFEGVYVLLEAGADIRPRTTGGADLTYFVARYPIDPSDARYSWREKVLQVLRKRGAEVDGALKAASDAAAQDRKDNPWRYHRKN